MNSDIVQQAKSKMNNIATTKKSAFFRDILYVPVRNGIRMSYERDDRPANNAIVAPSIGFVVVDQELGPHLSLTSHYCFMRNSTGQCVTGCFNNTRKYAAAYY
jgi:hypothetical protein